MSADVERGAKAVSFVAVVLMSLVLAGVIDQSWLWAALALEVAAAVGLAGDR